MSKFWCTCRHFFDNIEKVQLYFVMVFYINKPEFAPIKNFLADFASAALENKTLKPIRAEVVARGLEEAQKLLDHHASGAVSGAKPVLRV